MSRPRCATSVAMSSGCSPSLNCCSTQSRSSCDLSPWSVSAGQPSTRSSLVSMSHRRLDEAKTRMREPSIVSSSSSISRGSFCASSHRSTRCVMLSLALPPSSSAPPTSTMTVGGAPPPPPLVAPPARTLLASACTSAGHVALNMSVCRSARMCARMAASCCSKPMSSIRSASSSTKNVHLPSSVFLCCSMSTSRPGVATTTSGALRSTCT